MKVIVELKNGAKIEKENIEDVSTLTNSFVLSNETKYGSDDYCMGYRIPKNKIKSVTITDL